MKKQYIVQIICLLCLYLSVSFNITYWAMAKYDPFSDMSAISDAQYYMRMSHQDFENIPKRYYKRFLLPALAATLNQHVPLEKILPQGYEGVEEKKTQIFFGFLNILFLAGSAFLLHFFCKRLGFSLWECIAAALLYLTSFFTVNYYTVPLVDSAGSFFVMACIYAIFVNRNLWLFLCFLLGVLAKETVLVILLVILLHERKIFSWKFLACVPGIIVFILYDRMSASMPGSSDLASFVSLGNFKNQFMLSLSDYNPVRFIEFLQAYMFLWVLFFYAVFKCETPAELKNQIWLIFLPAILPFFLGFAAVGRVLFYAYPVVIPLSVIALRDIFKNGYADKEQLWKKC